MLLAGALALSLASLASAMRDYSLGAFYYGPWHKDPTNEKLHGAPKRRIDRAQRGPRPFDLPPVPRTLVPLTYETLAAVVRRQELDGVEPGEARPAALPRPHAAQRAALGLRDG